MTGPAHDGRPAVKSCAPDDPAGCALCGDEAIPARVLDIRTGLGVATVTMLATGVASPAVGAEVDAALDLVDDVAVGDIVLVHQGFVISRLATP